MGSRSLRPHVIEHEAEVGRPRRRFALEDRGFEGVPAPWRRFYRIWNGANDELEANELRCPTCSVVLRSSWELRPGDHLYCRACMTGAQVERSAEGELVGRVDG